MRSTLIISRLLARDIRISADPVISGDTIIFNSDSEYDTPGLFKKLYLAKITKCLLNESLPDNIRTYKWFKLINTLEIRHNLLTKIPDNCFQDCHFLKKVILPQETVQINSRAFQNSAIEEINLQNIEIIMDYAFLSCVNLKNIELPNITTLGLNAFQYSSIQSLSIGNSLTDVSDQAFSDCLFLNTVDFGDSSIIGEKMFYNCQNLNTFTYNFEEIGSLGNKCFAYSGIKSFKFGTEIRSIGTYCFENSQLTDVTFDDHISLTLGEYTFSKCGNLKKINIPIKLELNKGVFHECCNLVDITLTDFVSVIPESLFKFCKNLKNLSLPNVHEIHENAFYGCSNLESLDIPSIASIGDKAFWQCSKLQLNLLENRQNDLKLGDKVFVQCNKITLTKYTKHLLSKQSFVQCPGLKSLEIFISSSVNYSLCFSGCVNLESVVIDPLSDGKIGERMFQGCKNLKSVTFTDVVNEVGEYSFFGCPFNEVDLNNLTNIGFGAFQRTKITKLQIQNNFVSNHQFDNCYLLETIYLGPNVTDISFNAFANCTKLEKIEIDEKNSNFLFENSVLYSSDKKILYGMMRASSNKSLEIPSSVQEIADYAFESHQKLKKVVVSNSVVFGEFSFSKMPKLEKFTIDNTGDFVISNGMFANSSNLEKFLCNGKILFFDDFCFDYCFSLEEVEGTGDCTYFGTRSFRRCISLKEINLSHAKILGFESFKHCFKLSELHLTNTVERYEEGCFHSISIESLNLSNPYTGYYLEDVCFDNISTLKKVYFMDYCSFAASAVFNRCDIDYIYFSKHFHTNIFKSLLQAMKSSELQIEIADDNYYLKVQDNFFVVDKLTGVVQSIVAYNGEDFIEIPENVTTASSNDVVTQMYYENELSYIARLPQSKFIVHENFLSDDNSMFAQFGIFALCVKGDSSTYFDGVDVNEMYRVFVDYDYPYPTALGVNVERGDEKLCDDFNVQHSFGVGGNVFGLSKNEIFMLIVILLVSGILIAFVVYFLFYYKKLCQKKKNSSEGNQRSDEVNGFTKNSTFKDEIEMTA